MSIIILKSNEWSWSMSGGGSWYRSWYRSRYRSGSWSMSRGGSGSRSMSGGGYMVKK